MMGDPAIPGPVANHVSLEAPWQGAGRSEGSEFLRKWESKCNAHIHLHSEVEGLAMKRYRSSSALLSSLEVFACGLCGGLRPLCARCRELVLHTVADLDL